MTPAAADHQGGHGAQTAAKVGFAADFPALTDSEWNWPLGGFGGTRAGAPRRHVPVIFVHGNNTDAGDWYPVRDDFRVAGWTDQELFALSYNGLGGPNGEAVERRNPEAAAERTALGYDGSSRITNNDLNVPDLYNFILAVRAYTGSSRFSLVTHSLGVTLARKTLKVHPELRNDLVAFVGIAGGNHGTSFCPPGSEGELMSCDEIAAGTPWLAALNGPDGSDETYAPAKWMTIYDGSGAGDPGFVRPRVRAEPATARRRQPPVPRHVPQRPAHRPGDREASTACSSSRPRQPCRQLRLTLVPSCRSPKMRSTPAPPRSRRAGRRPKCGCQACW